MAAMPYQKPSCRQPLLRCDRTNFSSAISASGWLLERSVRVLCRIFEANVLLWFDSVLAQKKENRNLARLDPSITDQLRVDKS